MADTVCDHVGQCFHARISFTGTAGSRIGIGVTSVTGGFTATSAVAVRVFAPNGTELLSDSFFSSDEWELGALPANGEYLIVFDPNHARTGSWNLRMSTATS